MSFEIKPATRTGVIPLVGMYGKSGSGKSMSALLLARGLCGPKGRICLIDTEAGRGSLFADVIPGGYNVISLDAPFSPDRYMDAFDAAEKNSDVVIFDSMTHEHNGEGGVLDMQESELDRMAGDNYSKREAVKMASWIKPKMAHKKFIGRILRAKVPLICCLRGEEKTHIIKGEGGAKSKVVTDEFSTPIFDQRFLFELLLNLETIEKGGKGGYVVARKITHPDLAQVVPAENEQIGIHTGEAIAKWAAGGVAKPLAPRSEQSPVAKLKARLWGRVKSQFKDSVPEFEAWLETEGHIARGESLSSLDAERLEKLCVICEEKFDAPGFI